MDNKENDIFDSIAAEYEKLRSEKKKERDARVEAVYKKIPEIADIDRNIGKIGLETLNSLLRDPDHTGVRDEMKTKFRIMKDRRKLLLKQYDIPENFDKIHYKCSICKDTGYVENKGRCVCFKQKMIDRLYARSNMGKLINKQNFSVFRDDQYSDTVPPGKIVSPRKNINNIKNYCKMFIENFDGDVKDLLFTGDTGLGKTFMSSCVAKEMMDRGKTVLYISAAKLFRMLDDEKFGRAKDGISDIYDSDLLIIDDLGAEPNFRNNNSYILELINERLMNGKKMIISTNLGFTELEQRYTKRLTSRILENFNMMFFYGDDIRRTKM